MTDLTKSNIITKDEKTQGIKTDLSINILLLTDTKEYIKGSVEGWKAGANLNTIMNNFVVGQALESAMNHNETLDDQNAKIKEWNEKNTDKDPKPFAKPVTPEQIKAIENFNMFSGSSQNGGIEKPITEINGISTVPAHIVLLNAIAGHNNIGTATDKPPKPLSGSEGSIMSTVANLIPTLQNMSVFHDIGTDGTNVGGFGDKSLNDITTGATILPAILLTGVGTILNSINPITGTNGIGSNPNINHNQPSQRSILIVDNGY